jgi:DNA-binding Lrp family transcriptional regulator
MSGLAPWEQRLVAALNEPLPLVERPFAAVADRVGVSEGEVLERLRAWLADGTLRRFGARIRHRQAGYTANGMSVWRVEPDRAEAAGKAMASRPEVSHCYLRAPAQDWPYTLYAMLHGHTREEVLAAARAIAEDTGLDDYRVLFSVREFKKAAPRFFDDRA